MQFPNDRRLWSELDRGVVDVGSRLIDYLEEFGHKAKAVSSGVEKVDIDRHLKATLSQHREGEQVVNLNTPHSTN